MRTSSLFMLCLALAVVLFFSEKRCHAAPEDIFTYKVGGVEVSLLSEGQGEGKLTNLIGAGAELLKKYVPDGSYPTATNAFLIRTPERVVLVDTGFGRKLFENMKLLGVEADQVDAVLLTHMHGDHIGGLLVDGKVAFPKAKVYLAKQERDYWTNEEIMKAFPEDRQGGFKNALKTLAAYGDAVETFLPGDWADGGTAVFSESSTGIGAIAAFGHTPGHTMYMVASEGAKLLIWGDLTHAMAVQMPAPDVAMTYDVDPATAVASRKAVLRAVADDRIPVAGMHVPFPGIGGVASGADGGYAFTPAQ